MVAISRAVRKDVLRNRALLMESANALIAENGMSLSLNAVAHRAGVGVGTVYRHFPDRDALIQALLEQRVSQLHAIMAGHLDDADPVDSLRGAVFDICQMQADDRGIWELLSSGSQERHRELVQTRIVPVAAELVARANASGRMRVKLDVNDLPILLWTGGALHAYLGAVAPSAWRRYIQLMLDGLLADDDPARQPLRQPALSIDEIEEIMATWRPRGIRRD